MIQIVMVQLGPLALLVAGLLSLGLIVLNIIDAERAKRGEDPLAMPDTVGYALNLSFSLLILTAGAMMARASK